MSVHKEIIKRQIEIIGDDRDREGLKDTPSRVLKMWEELFRGYDESQKPKITTFENNGDGMAYDQIIIDTGYFYSQCEHHMIPFFGTYHFGYIPDKTILGLSKVARVVDFHSARLQIQERLVKEIVDQIEEAVKPRAIGLIMTGRHLCKEMRGVKKINGNMITSDLRGLFREEPETRSEFLSFNK